MIKVSNEELSKITQFTAGCNDMINGKFLLADIKIMKLLNMIADSDELYSYIKECMTDFDFSRELHRAEVKNRLNNGEFLVPTEPNSLVAFVFCLLVECDAKRMDFYNFISENFASENKSDSYKLFSQKILVPFRDAIASHFATTGATALEVESMTYSLKNDLKTAPVFEQENSNFVGDFAQNNSAMQNDSGAMQTIQNPPVDEKDKIWKEIPNIVENIENSVYSERHIKSYLKEELLYILKTVKYCTKYKDVKILSALVTAFDEMSRKFRSVQFVLGELKNKIEFLY